MKMVILAGGTSPERDVSLVTGKAVKGALEDLGHTVTWLDPRQDLAVQLWQAKQNGCEFVWIALHGAGGEDGTVQAMLDWIGLPYQGSGYMASALAMDKRISKQLFTQAHIPTPDFFLCRGQSTAPEWQACQDKLGSPVVIKPSTCGSTVGITIADSRSSYLEGLDLARRYDEHLVIERFIPGQEITVSILDGFIMPPIEIVPTAGEFYDYEAKYAPGGSRHLIPPRLPQTVLDQAGAIAWQAYQVLDCQGLARVDLRIDGEGQAWVLEVNTLPGMTPTSLCPDAAAALGWTFSELVDRILQDSLRRKQRFGSEVALPQEH